MYKYTDISRAKILNLLEMKRVGIHRTIKISVGSVVGIGILKIDSAITLRGKGGDY